MSTIKVKRVKSRAGAPADQKRIPDALGLHESNRVAEYECTPSILRMVNKIKHLVTIVKQLSAEYETNYNMNLGSLEPAERSTKTKKRTGHGPGSDLGGTSTRGYKGARSRPGYSKEIGFEGGQMPFQRRVPKFDFKNISHVEYKAVDLGVAQKLAETRDLQIAGISDLIAVGLISSSQLVKALGSGTLITRLDVQAHASSKTTVAAIEAAGG